MTQRPFWQVPPGQALPLGSFRVHLPLRRILHGGQDLSAVARFLATAG